MIRRDFLKNASLVVAGTALAVEAAPAQPKVYRRVSGRCIARRTWCVAPGLEEEVYRLERKSGFQYENVYAGQRIKWRREEKGGFLFKPGNTFSVLNGESWEEHTMRDSTLTSAFILWISVDWFDRITTPPRKGVISLLQSLTRKAEK